MKTLLALLAVSSLTLPAFAQKSEADKREEKRREAAEDKVGVNEGLFGFSGMLIGRLVSKDVERGTFTAKVDHVARVWRNNKSKKPRSAVGRTLTVTNVSGKWLDTLLLVKVGETLEFEAQHQRGKTMRFPGEWLHKVAPFKPENYPTPPDDFRGFQGIVVGHIEEKRVNSHELVLKVNSVERSFKNSRARKPESVKGKRIIVAGFWGRMQKPFDGLKKGETIRTGLQHRVSQSDHFSVVEVVQKVRPGKESKKPREDGEERPREREGDEEAEDDSAFPTALRGLRGVIRGKVVTRDAEKGELVLKIEEIPRLWKKNQAKNVQRAKGRTVTFHRISGRFLDVLLLLKENDRVEIGAFHTRGDKLDFPGELLRKVE